ATAKQACSKVLISSTKSSTLGLRAMSTPSLFMRPRSFLSICWCEVSIFISTRVFPATAYQNFTLTITPELLWLIYGEKNPEFDPRYRMPDFKFLKSFMDSELDCDKMDYLLR